MVQQFNSPNHIASSAMVEGYFKDLKSSIIDKKLPRMRIDKFFVAHLIAINGAVKLVKCDVDIKYKTIDNDYDYGVKTLFNPKKISDNNKLDIKNRFNNNAICLTDEDNTSNYSNNECILNNLLTETENYGVLGEIKSDYISKNDDIISPLQQFERKCFRLGCNGKINVTKTLTHHI